MQRATISSPLAYGARVAATILETPALKQQWMKDMNEMSGRLLDIRKLLLAGLVLVRRTPGDWYPIKKGTGIFSCLGLSKA